MARQSSNRRRKGIIIGTVVVLVLGLGGVAAGVAKSRHFRQHHVLFDPAVIESLSLEPDQQAVLEDLRRRVEADRGRGWKEMQSVKAVFDEERNADEPNLRRVLTEMKARAQTVWTDKEAMLEEGLQFYDALSAEQKRTVVAALGNRMDRFHAMRGHGRGRQGADGTEGWHGAREGARQGRGHGHGHGSEAATEFHLDRMSERLNLTDVQKEAVAAIIESQKVQLTESAVKLQANRDKLRDLIGQDPYDQAKVRAVAEERGQVVADLTVLRAQMRSEVRAQLDQDQRKALDEMFEQGHRSRGMM